MLHRILITGAKGQVGWELVRTILPLGHVVAIDLAELNLCDEAAMRNYIRDYKPTIIINPAAYTAVDKAEQEQTLAHKINALAPAILAEEAKKLRAMFIHYSTDYVFDGTKQTPWLEKDTPNPISVYGASKLAGEKSIQEIGGASIILRTSWVYGARGTNFLLRILQLAHERPELKIVDDQFGAPTWSRMLAEFTAHIIAKNMNHTFEYGSEVTGVYHLTAAGVTTWKKFADMFLALDVHKSEQKCQVIHPISSAEYPTPAKRPQFSVLSNHKFHSVFGLQMPAWEAQLECVMGEINANKSNL